MQKDVFRKGMVLAIIGLFIGDGVLPCATENIEQTKSKD